ncbi:MAG: hypothetical protein OXD36_01955 [Rhodobacter sp.]|nr:hypothetical protein [Rhodobacter sp.]
MPTPKPYLSAVTLAGALALAACGRGGGGGGGPATDDGECSPDFGKRASGDCYTEAEYREKVREEAEREAEKERKAEEDAGKARANAAALFAAFTQSPSIVRLRGAPAAYDGFRAATGDRHVQRVVVRGMAFEDFIGENPNDTAQPGNPVGPYRIADVTSGGVAGGESVIPFVDGHSPEVIPVPARTVDRRGSGRVGVAVPTRKGTVSPRTVGLREPPGVQDTFETRTFLPSAKRAARRWSGLS